MIAISHEFKDSIIGINQNVKKIFDFIGIGVMFKIIPMTLNVLF